MAVLLSIFTIPLSAGSEGSGRVENKTLPCMTVYPCLTWVSFHSAVFHQHTLNHTTVLLIPDILFIFFVFFCAVFQ